MEEIISDMNEESHDSQSVDDSWIAAFGESIGIKIEEPAGLTQGAQVDRITDQQMLCCKYCHRLVSVEQSGNFFRQEGRCKECVAEALISPEDADKVIGSCLCVLEEVYGVRMKSPASVRLCRGYTEEPVRIENAGAGRGLRQMKKLFSNNSGQETGQEAEQETGQKTISIGYEVSRVRLIVFFLEKNFKEGLRQLHAEKSDRKENRNDTPNEVQGDGVEEEKQQQNEEKETKQNTRDDDKEKAETASSAGDDKTNDDKALEAWLVANCLYTMGELIYAQQYIADYQAKEGQKKGLNKINSKLGVPWNVMGMPLVEIVRKL